MSLQAGAPCVLGIDIGTSGLRAVTMDASGAILANAAVRFDELSAAPAEHRTPALWRRALVQVLQRLQAQPGAGRVVALAVDGTSGTLLAASTQGTPLAPPLMYNDPVSDPQILRYVAEHAPRASAAHGATSGLAKALVLQQVPGAARLVHQADWLSGQFSGRFDLSDENNALKTGYDPQARRWPQWMERTGLNLALLPQVLPAGTTIGPVTPAAAQEFALPADALVASGTTDGCASFLATGAAQPGDGVTVLGSTLTVKLLSPVPLFAPEYGLYSHRLGQGWLAGGASNSGGAALAEHFSATEIAALSAGIDPESDSGLDYYPLPRPGERFPVNDPALAPRLSPRPGSDAHFLQGLLEGIAGIEALAYRRLQELGGPALRSLRSVGGGAANPVWRRIRERRLQVPFLPALSEEAAAGTARLALAAARGAGRL